jgi:hypothetical protein
MSRASRIISGYRSSLIHICRSMTVPAQLGPRELIDYLTDRELDWSTGSSNKTTDEILIRRIFSNHIARVVS